VPAAHALADPATAARVPTTGSLSATRTPDPAHEMALLAQARRELLLRAHRHRLRREDLEDCYSQATLELLTRARRGATFASRAHAANVLEQRFLSRVRDRRRALRGRSPMQAALNAALSWGGGEVEVVDVRAEVEPLVLLRSDLRRLCELAPALTADQRLVLACQVGLQMSRAEFCHRFGWSHAKYRKVAQRGRARLRRLLAGQQSVPPKGERRMSGQGPSYDISPHT
jgi:DNA-directed RNA polymerase specialized sigma24 family protein